MKYVLSKYHLLILLVSLFLSSIYIDWWPTNWNTASRASLPLSIVLEGNLSIDEYAEFTGDKAKIGEHYYSDKGPTIGFMMVPVVAVINIVYPLDELPPFDRLQIVIVAGAILFGSLPFSLCLLLLYRRKLEQYKYGLPLVFLYFFGSFMFAFAGSFYSHAFTGFLLLAAFVSLEDKKFFLSGLLIGLSFMTEYTSALFGVIFGLFLLINKEWKPFAIFSSGAIILILVQLLYNSATTGSMLEFTYKYQENFAFNADAYGFSGPSLSALYHITLSPYRGVLFYSPMLLIFLIGYKWKKLFDWRDSGSVLIWACFVYILLFSMSKSWYGGWTFGPRYLYAVPILMVYVMTDYIGIERKKENYQRKIGGGKLVKEKGKLSKENYFELGIKNVELREGKLVKEKEELSKENCERKIEEGKLQIANYELRIAKGELSKENWGRKIGEGKFGKLKVIGLFAFGGVGFIHALLDKATVLYPATEYRFPLIDAILPAVVNGGWNPMSLFEKFGISGGYGVVLFLVLFGVMLLIIAKKDR